MKYPKNYWILKYYSIDLKSNSNPPYVIQELNNKQLDELGISKWAQKQAINPKQEILCPSD